MVKNGSKEITLLGQNVNAYNFKGKKLSTLIYELEKIDELKKLGTLLPPKWYDRRFNETYSRSKKLMPFLHLPVQTGSNKLLKLMNRKHDKEFYLNIVSNVKKINANIEFSSDFIIGYPGETDRDLMKV